MARRIPSGRPAGCHLPSIRPAGRVPFAFRHVQQGLVFCTIFIGVVLREAGVGPAAVPHFHRRLVAVTCWATGLSTGRPAPTSAISATSARFKTRCPPGRCGFARCRGLGRRERLLDDGGRTPTDSAGSLAGPHSILRAVDGSFRTPPPRNGEGRRGGRRRHESCCRHLRRRAGALAGPRAASACCRIHVGTCSVTNTCVSGFSAGSVESVARPCEASMRCCMTTHIDASCTVRMRRILRCRNMWSIVGASLYWARRTSRPSGAWSRRLSRRCDTCVRLSPSD